MPIYSSELPGLLQTAAQQGSVGARSGGEQATEKLRAYLQSQAEQQRTQRALDTMKALRSDPSYAGVVNQGGGYSYNPESGAVSVQGNPYAKALAQGPHQADTFLKHAQGAYKDISGQLDAAQTTLTLLNQGNDSADRQALINEAKMALAGTGSRGIGQIIDVLSSGKTAGSTLQDKMNWLQNTPNVPTMPPAQRNAMRETVFARLPQVEEQGNQAYQQLAQIGPQIAPQANTQALLDSMAQPIQQKLSGLKKMHADYMQEMGKMQQPQASQPAQANPAPSTTDKLRSFFGGLLGGNSQPQQAPQQPGPAQNASANDPGYARYQQLLQKAGMGQ